MNRLTALLALGLTGLSTVTAILPALANTKVATKDAQGTVVISGLAPNSEWHLEFTGVKRVKKGTANACGVISLSNTTSLPLTTSSSLKIQGTDYLVSNLPVGAAPKCTNGVLDPTVTLPADNIWRDSNGKVYIKGLTAYSTQDITFNSVSLSRKVKANACGLASVRSSQSLTLGNYDIYTTIMPYEGAVNSQLTFNPANLPASNTPICRSGVLYLPAGFSAS